MFSDKTVRINGGVIALIMEVCKVSHSRGYSFTVLMMPRIPVWSAFID